MEQKSLFNEDELFKIKKSHKKPSLNDMSAKEWVSNSRNVWPYSETNTRNYYSETHGASFSVAIAEKIINIFSKKNDLIFDPFLGTGTTIVAAQNLDRKCIGIELNKKYFERSKEYTKNQVNLFDFQNKSSKKNTDNYNENYKIINDDCRNMLNHMKQESVQLTLTSPPYADFIQKSLKDRQETHKTSMFKFNNNSTVKQYSEDKNDFGNLNYDNFMNEIGKILELNFKITKPGGYSVWIVKDHRNTQKNIPYIPFHSDLASIGENNKWKFHDLIILDQNEHRNLVALGYPSVFYTNQNCSFIVVFRKSK